MHARVAACFGARDLLVLSRAGAASISCVRAPVRVLGDSPLALLNQVRAVALFEVLQGHCLSDKCLLLVLLPDEMREHMLPRAQQQLDALHARDTFCILPFALRIRPRAVTPHQHL